MLPKLLTHARMLTLSKITAEDLVQNTCVRVLDRMSQWQRSGRFDGWVIRIMESIWFNELRRKRQRQEQELPDPDLIADRGFENQAQAKMMLNMLQGCHVISDEDFSVLLKLKIHGYSYRELAVDYGESVGTMSSRISRAWIALTIAARDLDREGSA